MIPAINASKIYSILGNNSSLVPLAIKDIANSIGLTTGSYILGDKLEGKDRFLDEFGTQAIWLFGLPVFKKITDLTLYKAFKIDPKVDVRLLDNPEVLNKAIEIEKNAKIKKSLENLKINPKFSKSLALIKFTIATILTIVSYTMLTKYRHKKTKEAAQKEILAEHASKHMKQTRLNNKGTFFGEFIKNVENNNSDTSKKVPFTGKGNLIKNLQEFMFDPVKNLMIVDSSITTERLSKSRNGQEFIGYTIKEGATWGFMYFASKPIQKFLEKQAVTKHNKSIDLDARVIESDELKNAFENMDIVEESLKNFPKDAKDVEIFEYIHKNPEDFIVKIAKKCDEIPTLPKSDLIDNRKLINFGDYGNRSGVKGVYAKVENLLKQYKESGETIETFLGKVKHLKRKSVIMNLGTCIGALGIAVPAIMIAVRYLSGSKNFQVKEDLEKELILNA